MLEPSSAPDPSAESRRARSAAFPIAVIELGTSSIRMAVGETDGISHVRIIEQLVRGVSLGKDTFTLQPISASGVIGSGAALDVEEFELR